MEHRLKPGAVTDEQFYLLSTLVTLRNATLQNALRVHLVDGVRAAALCRENSIKPSVFSAALAKLNGVSSVADRLAKFYRSPDDAL